MCTVILICSYATAHINNLYNTTFWALVLKGKMSTTEAHNALKVQFLVSAGCGRFALTVAPFTGDDFKSEAGNTVQQVSNKLQYTAGEIPKRECSLPSDRDRAGGSACSWNYGRDGTRKRNAENTCSQRGGCAALRHHWADVLGGTGEYIG